jgi:hypothetical protein
MVLYYLKITDLLPLETYAKRKTHLREKKYLPLRAEPGTIFQRVDEN